MNKIILTNNESLEITSITTVINMFAITLVNKTIQDVEALMTKDNLTKLQLVNENNEVYGIYNNLICDSITKNLTDNSVAINLSKLDETQVKIAELRSTVDSLVLANLGV